MDKTPHWREPYTGPLPGTTGTGPTESTTAFPVPTSFPDDVVSSNSPIDLHDIANHLEAGEEFHRGEWVTVAPLLGPAAPWRRKAWIEGVEISRAVIARQLRDVADWHWSPDVS